jgi:hypothetical protein
MVWLQVINGLSPGMGNLNIFSLNENMLLLNAIENLATMVGLSSG